MFYGLLDLPWWGNLLVTILFTHITIACVTIFLHRHQAHRALELHPLVSHFFRAWLWLTTGMETKAWAAIHRKHHAKCETAEDPHSPQVLGLPKVLWQGTELYRREAKNSETLERYGHGTPNDWLEKKVYTRHSAKGIYLMLATNLLLFGVPGLSIWAIQMAWIPFFAAGVINGVGHYWGYRNFECPDAATNIVPWGILIGGEELHNNHHAYPTSAKLSNKWWEFDIGWLYIQMLRLFKLAHVKRLAPKHTSIPNKLSIDADTLKAIIVNRFQLFTLYSKSVLVPILNDAKGKLPQERGVWKRMSASLVREESLLDATGRLQLQKALEYHPALPVAYNFRQRLQAIWNRTTASQKELIEALQEWCHHAEETGIQGLQEFVRYLKGYSISSSSSA